MHNEVFGKHFDNHLIFFSIAMKKIMIRKIYKRKNLVGFMVSEG